MTKTQNPNYVEALCHCGAVTITLFFTPSEATECNCSLCRKYGVLWVYCDADALAITPQPTPTDTYAWNGRNVDFHRCSNCGCITHWLPRDATRVRRGFNARLPPPDVLAKVRVRHLDGADTKEYVD
jgi:hypothetical protein